MLKPEIFEPVLLHVNTHAAQEDLGAPHRSGVHIKTVFRPNPSGYAREGHSQIYRGDTDSVVSVTLQDERTWTHWTEGRYGIVEKTRYSNVIHLSGELEDPEDAVREFLKRSDNAELMVSFFGLQRLQNLVANLGELEAPFVRTLSAIEVSVFCLLPKAVEKLAALAPPKLVLIHELDAGEDVTPDDEIEAA